MDQSLMPPPSRPFQNSDHAASSQFTFTNVAPTQSGRHLTIALSDIMPEFQVSADRNDPGTWESVFGDSDDAESFDQVLPESVRSPSSVPSNMIQNEFSNPPTVLPDALPSSSRRARIALQAIQDRQSALNEQRRNMVSQPAPPPVLLLYEVQSNKTGSPQQSDSDASPTTSRYLPLVRAPRSQQGPNVDLNPGSTRYMIHPNLIKRESSHNTGNARWMPGVLPVELFEAITQHLSRDDIKNMRLVNREFEQGVSNSLFKTVVVPFNTELYDMIDMDGCAERDVKGKGKAEDSESKLQWKNAVEDKDDKLYKGHGLRVFQGFGSHIRRFGMSFEVKEAALRNPPRKRGLDEMQSYFGAYDWPSAEYTRYETLAGLERTADETSQMKTAFSHLNNVKELALCIDSGLGWVSGPEKSMRSQILQRDPPIFGMSSHSIADYDQQARESFWNFLESAYTDLSGWRQLQEGKLTRSDMRCHISSVPGLSNTIFRDTKLWPSISTSVIEISVQGSRSGSDENIQLPLTGIVHVRPDKIEMPENASYMPSENAFHRLFRPAWHLEHMHTNEGPTSQSLDFQPARLDTHQKEWLLEAEWAQRAFLSSYMLAIVDNKPNFSKITSLNLARISSQLVPLLFRLDFWDALPNLAEVSIGVIPDWRAVHRDPADIAETPKLKPSTAHEAVFTLLKDYIGVKPKVKKINFGWAAGGEHAEGCISRNNHILPAPLTSLHTALNISPDVRNMLRLPYVEHLTLTNCWIAPPTLVRFVKKLELASLKKITFESVSLTAAPRGDFPNQQPANHGGALQGLHNVPLHFPPQPHQGWPGHVFQVQPQTAAPTPLQQFGHNFINGPPVGVPLQLWATQQIQDIQTVMMQQGVGGGQLPQMWMTNPAGVTLAQISYLLGMAAAGILGTAMNVPGLAVVGPHNPGWQPIQLLTAVFPPAPVMPAIAGETTDQLWYQNHREGSWVKVIDALSPGPTLEMYRARDALSSVPRRRNTPLASLEFSSCGYVQLQDPRLDQNVLEDHGAIGGSQYHHHRRAALQGAMLNSSDKNLGRIVQHVPEREQDCLRFAWQMSMGWEDGHKAGEALYDGFLPGGTGRFSGIVSKEDVLGGYAQSESG